MVSTIGRLWHLLAAGALTLVATTAVLGAVVTTPMARTADARAWIGSAAAQTEYNRAYALGLEAYTYGLPLLQTNKTYLTQTSVNVSY